MSASVESPVHNYIGDSDADRIPTPTFESRIKRELATAIRKETRQGLLLLCAACLLNIPWMVAIGILKNNISYDPNANGGL